MATVVRCDQAWVVTLKDQPDAAAFIFIPTDFSVPAPIVDDLCIAPRPLNSSATNPCPPYDGRPCLVTQGFQLAFDVLRDQLLPAWQEIKSKDAPALPKRHVTCREKSLYMPFRVPHVVIGTPSASFLHILCLWIWVAVAGFHLARTREGCTSGPRRVG